MKKNAGPGLAQEWGVGYAGWFAVPFCYLTMNLRSGGVYTSYRFKLFESCLHWPPRKGSHFRISKPLSLLWVSPCLCSCSKLVFRFCIGITHAAVVCYHQRLPNPTQNFASSYSCHVPLPFSVFSVATTPVPTNHSPTGAQAYNHWYRWFKIFNGRSHVGVSR